MQPEIESIFKALTPNDVGATGTHQAGIVIPRVERMLGFFPRLDVTQRNPRVSLQFIDEGGEQWSLNYIYYNGKLLGFSTRNEYRLTGLTPYFRKRQARPGDVVSLSHRGAGWGIKLMRSEPADLAVPTDLPKHAAAVPTSGTLETIKLSGTWSATTRRRNVS